MQHSNNYHHHILVLIYAQQTTDSDDTNNNNIFKSENIPTKQVKVGDIDISYKIFGKGDPILLVVVLTNIGYNFIYQHR